jgi:hypothetical protein
VGARYASVACVSFLININCYFYLGPWMAVRVSLKDGFETAPRLGGLHHVLQYGALSLMSNIIICMSHCCDYHNSLGPSRATLLHLLG